MTQGSHQGQYELSRCVPGTCGLCDLIYQVLEVREQSSLAGHHEERTVGHCRALRCPVQSEPFRLSLASVIHSTAGRKPLLGGRHGGRTYGDVKMQTPPSVGWTGEKMGLWLHSGLARL